MADFSGKRNITCGVDAKIPPIVQIAMWIMINQNIVNGLDMDYLQVFKLKPVTVSGKQFQEINHSQEQPKRGRTMTIPIDANTDGEPVSQTIFVVDSGEYVTMMLANEY